MALFDFIRNFRNNNTPQIQAVIQDQPIMNSKQYPLPGTIAEQPQGNGLFNKIRGKIGNGFNGVNLFDKYDNPTNEVNYTSTDENGDTVLNSTIGTPVLSERGFFNDLARGANENYQNRFNLGNWQDKGSEQLPKNLATRLGEAIGTAGRVLNSPLGRGLITAGIVGATGGSGLEALAYGGQAGVTNQQLVNNDRMYRQALNDLGIDTSNFKGYVSKDDYTSLANNLYKQNSLQVRQAIAGMSDNTKRANMIMNGLKSGMITPQEAQSLMSNYGITINDLQNSNETQLLPYKQFALQTAPQVALGNLGLAQDRYNLDYIKFLQELEEKNNPKPDKAVLNTINENKKTMADIDAGLKLINENPQAYSYFKGKVGADIANRIDPKGVPTRTQIDNITAVYRKWLTGAQMSDAERKAYERFLPAPTDNAQIVKAKLQGMRDSIQRQNDVMMSTYGNNFSMPGTNTFNVDTNAVDAELKRRGL